MRDLPVMLGLVALWFALTLLVVVLIGGGHRTLRKLSDHGRRTTGIVRSIHPGRSWWVLVDFEVDGQRRSVQSRLLGNPNPRLSNLQVGQPVALWYLPEDPDTASIGEPRRLMRGDGTGLFAATLGFFLWLVVLAAWPSLVRRLA